MEGHTNAAICLVVANRLMYTGGADGSARCWVTEFGDCTRHYKGHKHSVICMKFDKGVCMKQPYFHFCFPLRSQYAFSVQSALGYHPNKVCSLTTGAHHKIDKVFK